MSAPTEGEIDIELSFSTTIIRVAEVAGLVHRLERHAGGHRAVADDRHHVVLLAAQVARHGEAERRRDRGRGVAGGEDVVLRLAAQAEAGEPAVLAQRLHPVAPAGEDLVRVGLVADVPDQQVARRVEQVVQGDRQLDRAQVRGEVAAGLRDAAHDLLAQLVGELGELLARRARRRSCGSVDAIEEVIGSLRRSLVGEEVDRQASVKSLASPGRLAASRPRRSAAASSRSRVRGWRSMP